MFLQQIGKEHLMRWVTIKPIPSQRANKSSANSRSALPAAAERRAAKHVAVDIEKTAGMLRWERMLGDAPFEMRYPRASWRFFGLRP
jgi:hypothetical protein